MIIKHAYDVAAEPVEKPGFSGMTARFLLTTTDGCPRYAVRLMEFTPGGFTSRHCHQEEHEMYVLEGEGVVTGGEAAEISIRAGDALFIEPCEYHQLKNTGPGMLRLICTVPMFPGKNGRETTPCG